jgi:hypothetical protein
MFPESENSESGNADEVQSKTQFSMGILTDVGKVEEEISHELFEKIQQRINITVPYVYKTAYDSFIRL